MPGHPLFVPPPPARAHPIPGRPPDDPFSSNLQWDQFEANRKITGRLATFNEEDYTTKLDMSKVNLSVSSSILSLMPSGPQPGFTSDGDVDRQAPGAEEIAAKLAAEIEGDASDASNIHVAEERGQVRSILRTAVRWWC